MEETGTEGEEVWQIAEVLHQDYAACAFKGPMQLAEELHARFVFAQFVSGEEQEGGVQFVILQW